MFGEGLVRADACDHIRLVSDLIEVVLRHTRFEVEVVLILPPLPPSAGLR